MGSTQVYERKGVIFSERREGRDPKRESGREEERIGGGPSGPGQGLSVYHHPSLKGLHKLCHKNLRLILMGLVGFFCKDLLKKRKKREKDSREGDPPER